MKEFALTACKLSIITKVIIEIRVHHRYNNKNVTTSIQYRNGIY